MVHQDKPTIEPTTEARAGVTGHNVRYVLAFGLAGVIILLNYSGLFFWFSQILVMGCHL